MLCQLMEHTRLSGDILVFIGPNTLGILIVTHGVCPKEAVPQYMLSTNDIILAKELTEKVTYKLIERETLESKAFGSSMHKMQYMKCKLVRDSIAML